MLKLMGLLGVALSVGLLSNPAVAQTPVPIGLEFQVNTYTTSLQQRPSVAFDPDGNFVVVWESGGSFGTDNDLWSIQGQRYDSSGTALGGEFQINTYMTSFQAYPKVAFDPDGNFVVVWESVGSYGTDSMISSVQGQRYDAAGAAVGSEFQVNTYTTSSQRYPSVVFDPDGNFVVVWDSGGSFGTDNDLKSIQGQRYEANGTAVGGEFQINTYTASLQARCSVAVDADGNFVAVWESAGSFGTDNSANSIQGQRYDAAGNPVGGQFQINSYTTSSQYRPSVAAKRSGDFVVVWTSDGSYSSDADGRSIQGQRYDATGRPAGGQFQVNTYTTSSQARPSVAVAPEDGFVVVWESGGSFGTDNSAGSIQGQRYDAAGNPVGGEFQVNSYTTSAQGEPSVALGPKGDTVIVWQSTGPSGSDNDSWSIQGQRFQTPIFSDGFESGDTSAWSGSGP